MVGIGLEVLPGLGLLGVVGSGLPGLPGLGHKKVTSEYSEDDSLYVLSDGGGTGEGVSLVLLKREVLRGRSFDSVGNFGLGGTSLAVGLEDVVDGVFVPFSFSFRVLSHFLWRGVNLESSLSSLAWGGWPWWDGRRMVTCILWCVMPFRKSPLYLMLIIVSLANFKQMIFVFHRIVHFGTKMSSMIKCYTAVRLKTVFSLLGPPYILKL